MGSTSDAEMVHPVQENNAQAQQAQVQVNGRNLILLGSKEIRWKTPPLKETKVTKEHVEDIPRVIAKKRKIVSCHFLLKISVVVDFSILMAFNGT